MMTTTNACAQVPTKYSVVDAATFAHDIVMDSTAYVLDVRTPAEYAESHIPGAHNLDWLNTQEFRQDARKLPKSQTLYVYCRSGRRSAEAASYLADQGYNVVDLDGGYIAWQKR